MHRAAPFPSVKGGTPQADGVVISPWGASAPVWWLLLPFGEGREGGWQLRALN